MKERTNAAREIARGEDFSEKIQKLDERVREYTQSPGMMPNEKYLGSGVGGFADSGYRSVKREAGEGERCPARTKQERSGGCSAG